MKYRYMVLLVIAMIMLFSTAYSEISQEEFDQWYDQITYLVDEIGTRTVGTEEHDRAHEYLLAQFEKAGMARDNKTLWESSSVAKGEEVFSIVGVKPALKEEPRLITVCAHYDSNAPGARDNASGVATVLMLMRHFSELPAYSDTELRFIAFSAEETGHQGSLSYVASLTEEEKQRSLAVFNIDILLVDVWDTEAAFSCDTLGGRIGSEYIEGTEEAPVSNAAVRAILKAMDDVGGFAPEDEGVSWCVPRHMGMSDHESFHLAGIDAVNLCFRGNVAQGGSWPASMHTADDIMGDFDLGRSRQALEVLITAVEGLAADHSYGS